MVEEQKNKSQKAIETSDMNIAEVTVMEKHGEGNITDGHNLTEEVVYTDPEDGSNVNDIDVKTLKIAPMNLFRK